MKAKQTIRAQPASTRPVAEWRQAVRRVAKLQADAEAYGAWQLATDQTIPFSHRWEHVQEVVRLTLWLAGQVDADPDVCEAAAWLHDICKGESGHAAAGAKLAEAVLASTDFPPAKIDAVTDAIRQHAGLLRPEGTPPMTPLEAAVLWDADKLSKLGVQALAYNLSAVYAAGRSLAERRRDSDEFVRKVLARTVVSMNTAPARDLAERRFRDMVHVLHLWEREENEHNVQPRPGM